MGIESSTTIGYGFEILAEVLEAYVEGDDVDPYEVMEELVSTYGNGLLTYGFSGTYYEEDAATPYVAISRMTTSISDSYGYFTAGKGVSNKGPTPEELDALAVVADVLGLTSVVPDSFVSILIH